MGNAIILLARILTGSLFIFSGLIKANDPVGFGYKLQEYFHVFNLNSLSNHAVLIAVLICSLEIILGGLLLLGLWRKWVVRGLLVLILFFTFLTFYSAFFEVVSSCGCFGDAIPLTPWESFIKDLILLGLILVLYFNWKKMVPVITDAYTKAIVTVGLFVISIGVGVYTVNFLPIIDFLPYKNGNHIPSQMVMPEGAEGDVYELMYTLKNGQTGEEKIVSDKVYMEEEWWKDENWTIVGDPTSRLVKKGYQIPITDLLITNLDGEEVTQEIIENPYKNLLIVAWDLNKTNRSALQKINEVAKDLALAYNTRVVLLTSSNNELVEKVSEELDLVMEILNVDAVPLKSMVRSNPGVLLMENGYVKNKWHYNTFPKYETLEKKIMNMKDE
jgi:uncharacterized membrane protein YphA (DoxX/SURF4 family)